MSHLSNCLEMITLMRHRGTIKGSELAEKLEVGERMIRKYKMDIEMAGIHIGTKKGRYGGYYLEKDSFIPELHLQQEELQALRSAYEMIMTNESFIPKTDFEMAYSRISATAKAELEDQKTMYYIKRSKPNPELTHEKEYFLKVHGAILTSHKIAFSYEKRDGEHSTRIVHPYALIHYNDAWYTQAYCEERHDFRMFKLSRMIHLTSTDDCFVRDKSFKYDETKLGICDDAYEVELMIQPPYAITIPESIWGENQIIKKNKDGSIHFKATMRGKDSIVKWILGMGSSVHMIGPENIQTRVQREVKKMMEQYRLEKETT